MVFSEGAAQATNRKQFKVNRADYLESVIPDLYLDDDIAASSTYISLEDSIINTHITFAANVSKIIPITSNAAYPNMNNASGLAPFFCKQTESTHITPFLFEKDIMYPLGRSLSEFTTSADFKLFIDNELLPATRLNVPTSSLTHTDLLARLGWFYILNTCGTPYAPSSYVSNQLATIYTGNTLRTVDGINGLTEYIWRNYGSCGLLSNLKLIPSLFLSGTTTFTSGAQELDNLKVLNNVLYSPLDIDVEDYKVETAFYNYIYNGTLLNNQESAGPFRKLIKALSYSIQDMDNEIEILRLLYNIHSCPEKYLPYVADLIGWNLVGHNSERWRLQLKNAVNIYKANGTKAGLKLAVDSMFTDNVFDLSSNIVELYESYIPNLLYYALNTYNTALSSFDSWTKTAATNYGVSDYSTSSMDTNIRYVIDYILYKTILTFPDSFKFNAQTFPIGDPDFVFYYRDRIYPIPPWEEIQYYKACDLSPNILNYLSFELNALGVPTTFTNAFKYYVNSYSTSATDDLYLSNGWLLFTSSLQFAPNYQDIMNNFQGNKVKYLSLWSGKSSHFALNFQASSFTFDKFSLDVSSSLAFIESLRIANKFIPAHSIPDAKLILNTNDQVSSQDNWCVQLSPLQLDYLNSSGALGSSLLIGFTASGLDMLNGAASAIFKRTSANQLSDPFISSGVGIGVVTRARNTLRRRNYHNLLPKHYLMTRSGFSMPGPMEVP